MNFPVHTFTDVAVTVMVCCGWPGEEQRDCCVSERTVTFVKVESFLLRCTSPRGLTFTWWWCYGLCPRHKPTKFAYSFYAVLVSISVFVALSPVFHSTNSPEHSVFSLSSSGFHSALFVPSTLYLCMKVSEIFYNLFNEYLGDRLQLVLSPDVILCGWLGSKHQLTN